MLVGVKQCLSGYQILLVKVANIQLHLFLLLSKVIGGLLVMTLNARES